MGKVNVSIVTYRTDLDELRRCLDSLRTDVVGEIYIVDNGSERRIADFCRDSAVKVNYIASENRGFGAGHNQAIRLTLGATGADGPGYHLVLNSDVYFEPDVLEELVGYMDTHPDVGQIQPEIVYPDGSPQYTVRRLPTPLDVFGRRFLPASWMEKRNGRYLLKDIDRSRCLDIPYHQGSFMLLSRRALEETGLFDERFFMYPEDIDLTRRIHRRYQTLYYPGRRIIHDHRAGSYHSLRLLRIHVVNMIRYFNKWGWFIDPERGRLNRSLTKSSKA